ncbi:Epidermal growth factor receptor substrate 15 [Oryzias melastigma]|uniref:Epidermal growth factor receptor substrate 15 n=1 Tax=Oryzias melastigma TaxID=30732 RepID=A0A834C4P5_ORYME|nr:Epidermal growth factor receptor substrate 15 [Oryzias melastigma]
MEEPAMQQEKIEASQEHGEDGGKADWKNDCSLSTFLKHSCLLCWSSPRDAADVMETDERILTKKAEIRVRRPQHLALELENAVTVESLELQEQQSDRKELEDTLVKLDKHKDKLIQQIKATRQLCYEESQQILSLQAEEVQKENQVEEYERELARARWRLKKLREEVKKAKKKVEEAGERDTPLQDSIRQSYEEILQEENTLCSLSGGMVTPESVLEQSASPADTTEDDPLPMRPWGRSQSLPAYADLIMAADGLPFCNNLASTREEQDSGTSSSKDRSDIEEETDEGELQIEGDPDRTDEDYAPNEGALGQLDFFQDNPFTHCQSDHYLFNEDLFPKTDSSGGFASDPFKGSNPFAADMLFSEENACCTDERIEGVCDEADTSLSCAENKASTGTQCFESEFPDEDSDIEISYSREDLDAIALAQDSQGFKPIQSSSEELAPEPVQGWRSKGQYSVESDPNGYELDLCPISPPSDIEENSLGSLGGDTTTGATALQQDWSADPFSAVPESSPDIPSEPYWTEATDLDQLHKLPSTDDAEHPDTVKDEHNNPVKAQNSLDSQNLGALPESGHSSFELSYEPTSQSSYDPYGFKLSPEHSSLTLLDPDEAQQSPESAENVMSFHHEALSSQSQIKFDPYSFDITASHPVHDSDPYGFKLSPEEENQEVLDLCDQDNLEVLGLSSHENDEKTEPFNNSNQGELKPFNCENQEVLEHCGQYLLDLEDCRNIPNQEVLGPLRLESSEQTVHENQQILDFGYENQEVVEPCSSTDNKELPEPCNYDTQEMIKLCSFGSEDLVNFSQPENQEVPDVESHENQEILDSNNKENQEVLVSDFNLGFHVPSCDENQELVDLHSHVNQEVLDLSSKENLPEANNNQYIVKPESNLYSSSNSSDSDLTSEDLERLELFSKSTSASNTRHSATHDMSFTAVSNTPPKQDSGMPTSRHHQTLMEGDLGSVFSAGGYISCSDVAEDLEPLDRRQRHPVAESVQPIKPVRPPRPSLRAKEEALSKGIDLK